MTARAQRRAPPRDQAPYKQKLRLWLRLLRASRAIEGELRERLRANFGSTLPRFDVMAALARNGSGMTMTELSRSLMVSNGNVTGLVDRLAAEGVVVRLPDAQDRRATLVRLTRRGARQFNEMALAHETWVGEILASVTPEDAGAMIELLNGLSQKQAAGVPRA